MYIRSLVLVVIALMLCIGVATGASRYYRFDWEPTYQDIQTEPHLWAPAPDETPSPSPSESGDGTLSTAANGSTQPPAQEGTDQPPVTEPPVATTDPTQPPTKEDPSAGEGAERPPVAGDAQGSPGPAPVQPPAAPVEAGKPVTRIPVEANEVFLTFDDGPSRYTDQIASYLHEQGIPAAFFWLGVGINDSVRERVIDLGHQLGSHTMTHSRLTLLDDEIHRAEMSVSQEALGGVPYFRPPFGAYNEKTLAFAQELGMTVIMWDVDSRDWELAKEPERIIQNVMAKVRPGSIILLHERVQTAEVLPQLIEALRAAGYTFRALPNWP